MIRFGRREQRAQDEKRHKAIVVGIMRSGAIGIVRVPVTYLPQGGQAMRVDRQVGSLSRPRRAHRHQWRPVRRSDPRTEFRCSFPKCRKHYAQENFAPVVDEVLDP
jgi:hypothetical protein